MIERQWHSLILGTIREQLSYGADVQTRNRKPLKQPCAFGVAWELRFGPEYRFRAFCRLDLENHSVHVLAVGLEEGNRLLIGGEEFQL